jgi:hypothetical protein
MQRASSVVIFRVHLRTVPSRQRLDDVNAPERARVMNHAPSLAVSSVRERRTASIALRQSRIQRFDVVRARRGEHRVARVARV